MKYLVLLLFLGSRTAYGQSADEWVANDNNPAASASANQELLELEGAKSPPMAPPSTSLETQPMSAEESANLRRELQGLERDQETTTQNAQIDQMAAALTASMQVVAELINQIQNTQDLRGNDSAFYGNRYPVRNQDPYYRRRYYNPYERGGRFSSPEQMNTAAGMLTESIGEAVLGIDNRSRHRRR